MIGFLLVGVCVHAHDKIYFDICSGISKRIHPRVSLAIDEEIWGDSMITGNDTCFAIPINVTSWLTASPFFTYGTDQSNHHLYREYRYGSSITFTYKLKDWRFRFRSRLAMRDKEISSRRTFQARNRFEVRPPWKWTEYQIGPYAQYESYFENRPIHHGMDQFHAHRGILGLSANLSENIYVALFYIRHWARSGDEWAQSNILGTAFYLSY